MDELEKRKKILLALKEAIANIYLESDFESIINNKELISSLEEKILKLGDTY